MQSISVSTQSTKTNIYAFLSPINGGLAFLSNCISVLAIVISPTQFVCGAVSGLFSLGVLVTGLELLKEKGRSFPWRPTWFSRNRVSSALMRSKASRFF